MSSALTEHQRPDWLAGTTHTDWLLDGSPIRGATMLEMWEGLDWSRAWVDLGPSVAGNLGPYWHVPLPGEDTVHRLYPKVLAGKWLFVIRQACEEVRAKCDSDKLQADKRDLQLELATAKIRIMELERAARDGGSSP